MKTVVKCVMLLLFLSAGIKYCNGQITYDYYNNPEKIGSVNPRATEYFIKSFEYIMQWGSDDADSAIFYLQEAIQEDSLYAIAYATLGHLIKYRGYNGTTIEVDSIAKLAEKALQINPNCADAHTLLSWVYFMDHDYQKAIEACKTAVKAEPDHRETWLWLGVRYSHLTDKIDSAIYAFHKCIETDPLFGQPHQKLGWIYLYDKPDFQKSAYHFRQMIHFYEDIEPRDERMILGYYGLGEALIAEGQLDPAIDTLDLLLQKCDNTSLLWVDKLRLWAYSGLMRCYLGKADAELNNFIALNLQSRDQYPDDTGITLTMLEETDFLSDQIKEYDFQDTLKQIRQPLYEHIFTHATGEHEINSAIYYRMNFLKNEKKFNEAVTELNILLKKYPDRKEIRSTLYYTMACNYALTGRPGKALKYLDLSVKEGYNDKDWIRNDPDLESLRDRPEFQKIVQD